MIMQYRKDKNGNEISVLGYGCMRFTTVSYTHLTLPTKLEV